MHRPRLVTNVPALSPDPDGQCRDLSVEAPAQGRGVGRWVLVNASWYQIIRTFRLRALLAISSVAPKITAPPAQVVSGTVWPKMP